MRMTSVFGLAIAAAVTCSPAAWAADKASEKFIKEAIQGNMAEVEMGRIAQEKGNSDGVRSFGQMLQQDHSAANQKASAVASQMGVTPPTEPTKKQKADAAKMSKLSGAAFDRQFAKHMVMDHKKDISAYTKASKKNDEAGGYAKDTLPTLQKHLETAQGLTKARGTASR